MIYINAALIYLAVAMEVCIRLGAIAEAIGDGDE